MSSTEMQNAARNAATVAPKTFTKMGEVERFIEGYHTQLSAMCPGRGLEARKIMAQFVAVVGGDPKLLQCEPRSILVALMQCEMLKLSPNKAYGLVWFIPYGNQLQTQLGYKGVRKLALRSQFVADIEAEAVYEGDQFDITFQPVSDVTHKPGLNKGKPECFIGAYAVATSPNGSKKIIYLTRVEIERLRIKNPSQKSGPKDAWATNYAEMGVAKAIKMLCTRKLELEEEIMDELNAIDERVFSANDLQRMEKEPAYTPGTFETEVQDISAEVQEPTESEQQPASDGLTEGQRMARAEQAAKDAKKADLFGQEGGQQ